MLWVCGYWGRGMSTRKFIEWAAGKKLFTVWAAADVAMMGDNISWVSRGIAEGRLKVGEPPPVKVWLGYYRKQRRMALP